MSASLHPPHSLPAARPPRRCLLPRPACLLLVCLLPACLLLAGLACGLSPAFAAGRDADGKTPLPPPPLRTAQTSEKLGPPDMFTDPDVPAPQTPSPAAPSPAENPGGLANAKNGAASTNGAADGDGAADTKPAAPQENALPPGLAAPERKAPALPPGTAGGEDARTIELMRRGIVRMELRPARPLFLTAPFSGTLKEVRVQDGERVTLGQPVALFDAQAAERGLADARVVLAKAIEQVRNTQKSALMEQEAAAARLAQAADELRAAEERLQRTTLTAPFAGRVTEVRAHAGQMLKQGETVVELAGEGDMEVVATVPSVWVSRLQPGHTIWVYVEETAKSYEAAFVRFGGRVESSSRTVRAYAAFASPPEELLPGMSGRVNFFPPRVP